MAIADSKNHDYHLVDLSPWPIFASMSVFMLSVGAVLSFHDKGYWLMILGLISVLYVLTAWWRDVIREANTGYHTPVVRLHHRYGFLLFIVSEIMFFVAWFWAYFDVSLYPDEAIQFMRTALTGGYWPPKGIETLDPWHIPFINTLILLTSGTTVTWAHHALINNDRDGVKWGLLCTIILGVIFTSFQIYEYHHATFDFSGHIYGASFYMATGFHGFHVVIGTIFLIVCYGRLLAGDFTAEQHIAFESATWYWHFVDVVWLFLFVVIYVFGAGTVVNH